MKQRFFYFLSVLVLLFTFTSQAWAVVAANLSITTDEDRAVTINLWGKGIGRLSFVISTPPSHGSAQLMQKQVTYTPEADYYGTDSFIYTVTDRRNNQAQAIVTLTIHPVDDPESAGDGLLYGFWGMQGYLTVEGLLDVAARFNTSILQTASSGPNYTVTELLPVVHDAGMKITLRMSGSNDHVTTDGNFDLEKWKAYIANWENSGVQEYIDNGTLVGHMLLDDIHNFTGRDPDANDLEDMAQFSKEILPGLMTYVRDQATTMPIPETGQYEYVDAIVNQYSVRKGPVDEYTAEEVAAAHELGVGIINGLNIANGGDGSSGQVGWSSGKYAMSADEILAYGEVLMNVPDLLMFLMWEYDGNEAWSDGSIGSDYFDQPALQEAIFQLGLEAAEY